MGGSPLGSWCSQNHQMFPQVIRTRQNVFGGLPGLPFG